MPDAFISYARSDAKEFVARLAAALEAAGKEVWVDLEDIPPASRWREALEEGVLSSDAFVYVISPGAVASEHCRGELEGAAARNKRIIPIAHLEVPDDRIPEAVGGLNWIPQTDSFGDDFDGSLRTLIQAIETDAELVREHTRWQQRAEGWRDEDRDHSLLARGGELAEAEGWLTAQAGREPAPTALQGEWLAASRQAARRRQGIGFGAIAVALLVTAALAVVAIAQRNDAREQRDAARASQLTSDAVANLEADPELSLILALEAARTDESPRTEQTLQRALLASRVRERFVAEAGVSMNAVAFSEDGKLLATGDGGGRATVWDAATGQRVAGFELEPDVGALDFTPDAGRLVVGTGDGGIHVLDVESERELEAFTVSKASIGALDVSPDGERLAAGSFGGAAGVVDLDGRHPVALGNSSKRVGSISFTSKGDHVLTASYGEEAVLWDPTTGARELVLRGQGGPASDAEMSPDGRYIATANRDGSAVLWDARTGEPVGQPLVAVNESAVVHQVAFVPGEKTVVTAGGGGQVDAWDIETRKWVSGFRGHSGVVVNLAVSPDGQRIATAGFDGTARIWDVSQRLYATEPGVGGLSFSPDGRRVLYTNGQAVIVDAETGEEFGRVHTDTDIRGAGFGPAGETLVAAGRDGLGRVYDLGTGERTGPSLRQGNGRYMFGAEFSAAGDRVLTASLRNGASVWSWPDGTLIGRLGEDDRTLDAALSPDGTRAARVDLAGKVIVYDVAGGEPAFELTGHTDTVSTVAYDGTGDRLVTASEDGTSRVWDAASGDELLVIGNDGQAVRAAALNGDGSIAVTTSANGQLRVHDADTGFELMRADGPDWVVAASPAGDLVAGAVFRSRASVYECDVCGLDLDGLESLAEQRITRELTDAERERYLDSG